MPLHGLSVAAGQDKARTDTARGTDGTEDIGRLRALVPERRGSAAASRPAPGEHGFLADPGLPPNFYREPGSDLPQPGGEVFLKSFVLPLVAWSRRYLAIPQRPQFTAHRRLINRNAELFEYPMARSFRRLDRRNRSALNKSERLSLPVIELGRLACRLAVNQTIRPLGRRTQSRTTWSPTVPIRAAAVRRPPSFSASAKPPALSSIANRRSAGPSKSSRNSAHSEPPSPSKAHQK